MQEVNINTLVNELNYLIKDIPDNIIIVGKISRININYKYDELDLSKVECNEIFYWNQEGESIKNHILSNSLKYLYCCNNKLTSFTNVQLPNSLKELYCSDNQLTSLPDLPNSLKKLCCSDNTLTSLPNLQNSLQELNCSCNKLTSLPDLPNSLQELTCDNNQLELIPDLPNSLIELTCYNNQLTFLPNLPNSLNKLYCNDNLLKYLPNLNKSKSIFINCFIDYIEYEPNYQETNIVFGYYYNEHNWEKSCIEIKDYGKITSKEDYISYMEKVKLSKIKSARK